MAEMNIFQPDLLKFFPQWMREDVPDQIMARHITAQLIPLANKAPTFSFWAYLDQLSGPELDEIAWEIDCDWYDATTDIEGKRKQIKDALNIKAHRGTKWSVETILDDYFGSGWVQEWNEYNGKEYTFRAFIDKEVDEANFQKFLYAIEKSKNVRSHFDGFFFLQPDHIPDLRVRGRSRSGMMKHFQAGTTFRQAFVARRPPVKDFWFQPLESASGMLRHERGHFQSTHKLQHKESFPVGMELTSIKGMLVHEKAGEMEVKPRLELHTARAVIKISSTKESFDHDLPEGHEPDTKSSHGLFVLKGANGAFEHLKPEPGAAPDHTFYVKQTNASMGLRYRPGRGVKILPGEAAFPQLKTKSAHKFGFSGHSQKGLITRGGEKVRVL